MNSERFTEAKRRATSTGPAIPPPLPTERRTRTRPAIPPPLPSRVAVEKILAPADLDPLKDLLLFAELVVEGWFSGKHRSLDFGSNAEFAEYEHYQIGDPVSLIDWKVYARSRQLFVRKHREEKEMTGYLMVDVSGSMAYQVKGRDSKQVRAARIAASLSYLMGKQGDKSALTLFSDRPERFIPPGSTRRHLHDLVSALESVLLKPKGLTKADSAIDQCIPLFKKQGSLVVISDFFTDLDRLFDALSQFQHRGFDVLLLHIQDPDERFLPNVPLARFVDMETSDAIQVAPDEIRRAYRREMEEMKGQLTRESVERGIEYHLLSTDDPYIEAIEVWMGMRTKSAGGRRK